MENPIGTKIKQLANKKNLSIHKLEKIAGFQKGGIQKIVEGRAVNPTLNTLSKICAALECSVDDLLGNLPGYEEFVDKPIFFTELKDYANLKLDHELFIQCVERIKKCLEDHEINIKLSREINLIIELYLYSYTISDKQINEKYVQLLIAKLRIPIQK